ncbi:MAG: 23S rRNA (uracil(1939)-C(5))-methyltransferase RlmD [Oscillospiraceae bacterium]|nr:23S rRNA (uracil(1939)-C(5))-methyltransferase RlmD [Oscillospiraceae bacterium]
MDENRPLPCPHAKKCGGCQLQHLPYERQLAQKQRRAQELLDGFGPVLPILGMEEPTHYRNKVTAAFALDRNRKVVSGIYQPGSHAVVPVDDCLIEDRAADAILVTIRRMLPDFRIRVYDERSGTGWLRHVLVRRGFATGQALVVLVAASPVFPTQKPFVKALTEKHPEITSVVLNVNDRFGPVVLGAREKVLYGDGYIEDILCSHRFRISPRSFYQINPVQTEKLYRTAVDFAGLTGTETVLDAYCGVGTIGITASAHAGQVVGVELNRDAVADAIANARLNGIKNCWFTAGDAGAYMEQMARDGMRPDLVFLDPPRAGSDERFLRSLLRCAPEKVVYVSCDPETLARDLALLAEGGYRVQKLQPVDMFPYTKHIECVCLLSRSKPEPAGGEKKRYQSGNREEAKEPSAAGKSFPPRGKRKRKEHGNGHNVDTKTL